MFNFNESTYAVAYNEMQNNLKFQNYQFGLHTIRIWDPWLRGFLIPIAQQPAGGQGLPSVKASRSHLDTRLVGILWTSDQPDAETSTWQHS